MQRHFLVGLTAVLTLAGWAYPAAAVSDSDKEAIRALANEAAQDFDRGQFDAARDKFLRAYTIAKVPRLALRAAQANVKLGRLVAAYELFRQAVALEKNELWIGNTQEQAQAEARQELTALQSRLPKLTINVEGASAADVAVTVDGEVVPGALIGIERYVDPGSRQVIGKFGTQEAKQSVSLGEGARKQIVLKFTPTKAGPLDQPSNGGEPAAPSQPAAPGSQPAQTAPGRTATNAAVTDKGAEGSSAQRTWGWIGVTLGAAGLVAGGVAGVFVATTYKDLNANCANRECDPGYESKVKSYDRWQTISTVGLIAGGVLTVAGVTLLLTSPSQETKPNVALWMGPASAGVRGAF
jgi:hypothetical protein